MKILVIGATGTIGGAVTNLLGSRHEGISANRTGADFKVDIVQPDSLRALFKAVGPVDAIVNAAGTARFAPLDKLSDDDFDFSLGNKLMGQVNVIRYGLPSVRDGGSITVTSGVLAWHPMPGSAAISVVNAGLEAFVGAAALEAPRRIRVNVVSPPWVSETLRQLKMDPAGGRSASDVAQLYAASVEGKSTGHVVGFGPGGAVESRPLASR